MVYLRALFLAPFFFPFFIFISDVTSAIPNSSFLLYADGIKTFNELRNDQECYFLEAYITLFQCWCYNNRLILNPSKTKVVSYNRKTQQVQYSYKFGSTALLKVTEIRGLGVLLESSMAFSSHVTDVTRRSLRCLVAVCRYSGVSRSSSSLNVVFGSPLTLS